MQPAVKPKSPPRRIFVDYKDPNVLHHFGPLVLAQWQIPRVLRQGFAAIGRTSPSPVNGHMLIDTGATATCISEEAARDLGLHPVGLQMGFGAGGEHQNPVFHALLILGICDPKKGTTVLGAEQRVQAIPKLEESFRRMDVRDGNGNPVRLIGLLGRDFLRHTKFTYDGHGNFEVIVRLDTLGAISVS